MVSGEFKTVSDGFKIVRGGFKIKGAPANFSPTKKTDTLCKLSYY